ncbi:MAG: EamA family transporter [Gemmatimonadales bacterium]|nr:EamA family transporter [Gemmatimonadales bacterium]
MTTRTKALLAWGLCCTVWGSTYLAIRIGVQVAPPFLFASLRFLIAGTLLGLWLAARGERFRVAPETVVFVAITGLFLLLGGNGGVSWAEQFVPSGQTSVIVAMVPLFIAMVEVAMPGARVVPSPALLAGLLIGFAGSVLLVGASWDELRHADWRGFLALTGACLSWAIGTVLIKRRRPGTTALVTSTIQMLAAGLGMLAVAALRGELAAFTPSRAMVAPLAYLVVAGSLIGFTAYAYALEHLPATLVGTYAYVNPIVAVLLGWAFAGEVVTVRMLVASLVILASVAWIQLVAVPRQRAAP